MSRLLRTGIAPLDHAVGGGLRTAELTVIAGPSSHANAAVLAALKRGLRGSVSFIEASAPLDADALRLRTQHDTLARPRAVFVDSLRMIRGAGPGCESWGFTLAQLASELDVALVGTWLTPDRPSNRAQCSDLYDTVAEEHGLLLLVEGRTEGPDELDVFCIRMFDRGMPFARLNLSSSV